MEPNLSISDSFTKLGIALGLGLLVGLQRERSDAPLAGIRTFPIITLLGTVTGLLALQFGGWIIAAGLLSLASIVIINTLGQREQRRDFGVTTEVAMLLMFAVGAYLVGGRALVAVVLVGGIAVLLHLKPQMHAMVRQIGDKDFKAIMQFVLITLVILPVLPNQEYGPYKALNPYKIWLLVVLTVGISLGGYLAYQLMGARTGSLVGGILGGLVSSTATTLSYARRTRHAPQNSSMSALVIMIASTVVFMRIIAMIGIVAPSLFPQMAGPLGAMLGVTILIAGILALLTRREPVALAPPRNPSELKPALIFGLLFALVLLGVAAAKARFGSEGLYILSILSGLTDMDAITLSLVAMTKEAKLDAGMAWRLVLVASMANFAFKGVMIATVGHRKLLARILLPFGMALVGGAFILWLWPGEAGEVLSLPQFPGSNTVPAAPE